MKADEKTTKNVKEKKEEEKTLAVEHVETRKWTSKCVDEFDAFLFDCDGVLWTSSAAIDGAKETLQALQKMGKKVIFLSNNATKSLETYQKKILSLFDLRVSQEQVFTSALATATYVSTLKEFSDTLRKKNKILLVGSIGLYEMLTKRFGFEVIWTAQDIANLRGMSGEQVSALPLDRDVRAVIVSMDVGYGYNDISLVCRYMYEVHHEVDHPLHFIGSNDDTTFPQSDAVCLAGTGSLVASVKALNEHVPFVICGKPHALLYQLVQHQHQIDVKRSLMVGDRLNTDVQFGINCGMQTLLVLTGISTREDIQKYRIKPNFILDSVKSIIAT
ncbi:Alkaline phosphatase specific for p-nitrophenyl phosphate [Reticulomyxa filosa]|uniref:Alkaline phosphatase specific for p-nitrophenyl phosphate n=1 Tax=Reticulomyxa filosa TaxID=46433 RepID=X6LUY7_RETFI|nr:Alkaline phosphatase specific for p-nitrophenyl phosphate [Reticulomyxa filosa]|eukprot:ETO05201.1 Alkaline phosphatase specific for p-nitrophenyl phosphate [Reticulomyxa filosa]